MMRNFAVIFFTIVFFLACKQSNENTNDKTNNILAYQKELQALYIDPNTTPLSKEEQKNFKGITFFPVSNKYNVKAKYTAITDGKIIPFPTSSTVVKDYKELGLASFTIDNKVQTLTLYVPAETISGAEDLVFLPFRDATSGKTSYGAGRYIEMQLSDLKTDSIQIDFNRAFNPYCAYSAQYSCPRPPANNTLTVAIEAGVSYIH